MKEFKVSVCVLQATKLSVGLNGNFMAKGETVSGTQIVEYKDGCILWNDNLYQELSFIPQQKDATIEVYDVKIGINFHWERTETQTFKGAMNMLADNGKICAINILNVEDYLISVISSEMKATSPLEFLKSHAVISRSWLIAQIEKRRKLLKNNQNNTFFSFHKNDHSLIRWYDREDHILFDVCADDHCQRYQGIQRADNPAVIQAVNETRGLVLMSEGKICDARFSKCCGGMMEQFDACWEDVNMPYLVGKRDIINPDADAYDKLDLTEENDAKQWIQSNPPAFCNTSNYRVLSNILNAYDTETMDFYRWELTYKQAELAELINKKTKIDFGEIIDLVRAYPANDITQTAGIGKVSVMKNNSVLKLRVIQNMVDAVGAGGTVPAHDTVHLVVPVQQKFRKICAVLPCNACEQCLFHVLFPPNTKLKISLIYMIIQYFGFYQRIFEY